jgi:hypothetical protein
MVVEPPHGSNRMVDLLRVTQNQHGRHLRTKGRVDVVSGCLKIRCCVQVRREAESLYGLAHLVNGKTFVRRECSSEWQRIPRRKSSDLCRRCSR